MTYFYDYFAKEYRDAHNGQILPSPEAIFQDIRHEEVKRCRDVLKNTFSHYRSGRNAEALARLLKEYREYVSCCHDEHAKNRYNALVYRYMVDVHVGSRAIAARLGVAKETALNYIDRCMDEMLVLCMGVLATGMPGQKTKITRMLVDGNRLLRSMAGEYVLCLFHGKRSGRPWNVAGNSQGISWYGLQMQLKRIPATVMINMPVSIPISGKQGF